MAAIWILCIGVGYLALCAFLFFIVRPRTESQRLQTIVNYVGLPLTAEIVPTVLATLRRDRRTAFLSVAVGIVAAAIGMILAKVQSFEAMFYIDFTAVFLALAIGSAIATVARENARQRSLVRFARLRVVGIADYRGTIERWAPRIVVTLALAIFAFRAAANPGGVAAEPPFLYIFAVALLLSLAISEGASRLLVRRGQPAGSELELAWDDALRSRALNTIALAPLYLGGYLNMASMVAAPISHSGLATGASLLTIGVTMLFAAALLASVFVSARTKPQQRYLRRLWPELAAAAASPHQSTVAPKP